MVSSKSFFLDGGADDQPAVAARHQISAWRPQHVIEERRFRIHAQRQHLAFYGAHRRPAVGWQPGDRTRPGTGGEHHDIGSLGRAVFEHDAGRLAALHGNFLDRPMLVNCHAGSFGGDTQRLHQLAVIDLMILRREQRAGDFSRQMRLSFPRVGGRQPFERQVETTLKLQAMGDFRLIVRGQGEQQGALAAQFDVDAAGAQQLVGKGRPARLAVAPKRYQRFLTRLGLAARRQHAGRGMACARTGLAAVEHRDRCTAGEPPGDTQADHAGADDSDARLFADMGKLLRQRRLPSLA